MNEYPKIGLIETINQRLSSKENDSNSQISTIHPEILIQKNSVNLLVGMRGSGKTYNSFREMAKICLLENNPYSKFVYVSNKTNDSTARVFDDLITLDKITVRYDDADEYISNLYELKGAYDEVVEKNIENQITDENKNEILEMVGVNTFSEPWHTAVLFDDAIQIFKKKGLLYRKLFENRQPRVTYFITLQDATGIDPSVKANIDSYWLFGGFSRQKFLYHYSQINCSYDKEYVWSIYRELTRLQALVFQYHPTEGTKMVILEA